MKAETRTRKAFGGILAIVFGTSLLLLAGCGASPTETPVPTNTPEPTP